MARVAFAKESDIEGDALEAYRELDGQGKLTNMKQVLLNDYPTYAAFTAWYYSWDRLVEIVGLRAATVYAHAISTVNSCQLCSLYFVHDLRELGVEPNDFEPTETEALLQEFADQFVKDPTAISDETFAKLKERWNDSEIVAIVGFAGQMVATNNFNSALRIDVDQRLLPIKDEFRPATWRRNIG